MTLLDEARIYNGDVPKSADIPSTGIILARGKIKETQLDLFPGFPPIFPKKIKVILNVGEEGRPTHLRLYSEQGSCMYQMRVRQFYDPPSYGDLDLGRAYLFAGQFITVNLDFMTYL